MRKIQELDGRWIDMTRSKASFRQKLQVLVTVVWANILHGISSAHLGDSHFNHMRTQAVRALNEHHMGTSPLALLSLTAGPQSDPGYYALWHAIVDCRHFVKPDEWSILDELSVSTRQRPIWQHGFHDQYGLPIDLY